MKQSLRITFLLPHLKISGGVRVILLYADLLARRGHSVVVCVQSRSLIRRFMGNLFQLKPSWFSDLYGVHIKRIAMFSDEYIPSGDIIVAGPASTALIVAQLPPSKGKKFYFIQHDEGLYHVSRDMADQTYASSLQKIVVSTWLQDILRETYHQDSFLLLNTVLRQQFHPVSEVKPNDGLLRILLLDHTYEWKGTLEGVKIVQEIKKTHPHVRLMLFGTRKVAPDMPCDEYYYHTPQEKLSELYSRADIFLCPSWDEGFGLPSLEAMACGTPVVTYDNGGSRDFAFHEKTALVAPRRDADSLKKELLRLVDNEALRRKIGLAGLQFVETLPTWEDQVVKLEEMFNSP